MISTGIAKTIESMCAAAAGPYGAGSHFVTWKTRHVLDVRSADHPAKVICDWVNEHIGYAANPAEAEVFLSPEEMMREVDTHYECNGDADDTATLIAAMGLSVGLDARFVLVRFEGRPFATHVFAQLKKPDEEWPTTPITERYPTAVESVVFEVRR